MKYITLVFEQAGAIDKLPTQQHQQMIDQHSKLQESAKQQGAYLSAAELKPPLTAKSVQIQQGEVLISDGPFAETKEWLLGYYLFDCPSLNHAIALAEQIPTAPGGGMELRPLDDSTDCGDNRPALDAQTVVGKTIYALLNYHPEAFIETCSTDRMQDMIACNVKMAELARSKNEYLGGHKLMETTTASSLRGDNNRRIVTDGPFCESKEVLLGLHLLACDSQQAALDYAASLGDMITATVEVRAVNFFNQQGAAELVWKNTD